MKKLIMTAVLAVFTATGAFAETVRLGTEGAYEPWNFVNDAGELDGFEIELGNELCKRASLTCEWVKNDWDSIIPNLKSGNYDAIIAGMSVTEERQKAIDFTEEYYPADPSSYAALAGADASVSNGVVAAQTATIHAGYLAGSSATLVEFASAEETIAAVRNGEADAWPIAAISRRLLLNRTVRWYLSAIRFRSVAVSLWACANPMARFVRS